VGPLCDKIPELLASNGPEDHRINDAMQQLKIKKSHSLNQFEIARVDHPIASWDSRITVILIDADLGER
jgi:hypothetical protein